jgi:hypothetical protein
MGWAFLHLRSDAAGSSRFPCIRRNACGFDLSG